MFKIIYCVLLVFLDRNYVAMLGPKFECGYKQCPQTRDGALNVHLIPHSHMDAGWVKTYDEYYFGTKTTVSTANVHLIYHSVLSELLHDKRRKFTFSESAYFWRWWKEQRPTTRATFRSLVQEGRIEFAGGGWVQSDAATLDYLQIIDHYTWGLRKLNDTLGPCGKPKAAWQIDTYGHTREQTSLLAQMGYDGFFIGRVDHREREAMIDEDRMEFMWRGSDVLGKMSDIMTHTLFNLYNAPEGFCFDFLCSDEPIVDDPDSQAYNAEKRVNDFVTQLEKQAKYYDHDNILVTMGGDFTYQSAANWYINMDKLINHVNTHPGNISDVNIFYSTPSCYLKAIYLYGRRDKAIYTEKNDLLPYASDSATYWTGYYTSRPALKYFIRRAHVFLQIVKQLTVIAKMGDSFELHLLRHAVNLVLHHDAITGTSQQHVTNDFIRRLSEAVEICTKKLSNLLSYLTPTWGNSRRSKNAQQFVVCHQLNMSQCRFAETQDTMLLIVYNPTSVKTYHQVRLPAVALQYTIKDYNDQDVEHQIVPLPAAVINLPGRTSTAIQELYFEAENIPPLGYTSYFITPVRDQLEENAYAKKHTQKSEQSGDAESQDAVNYISNEFLKVTVNKDTGLLESIQPNDGDKIEISQNFFFYSQGQQTQQSGAYCFRPEHSRPTPVAQKATYSVVRGIIVKEIRQRFTDWATQVIRLYRGEDFVEVEWVIGPVPIGTDLGKEVVTLFTTNITNNGIFYTDSNARQMIKRTCWNESTTQQQKKPLSACYYPVVSQICLHSINTSVGLCVLTDRSQGGTSYKEGEIELMIHRRLLTDDGFGLEESLNEEEFGVGLVVRGKQRIMFSQLQREVDELTFEERMAAAARRWLLEPWLFITTGDKLNTRKWQNIRNKRYSALRVPALPRHVHLLTLEPWKAGSVLLRLENTLQKPLRGRFANERTDGGPEEYINKPSHVTVNLKHLFVQMKIRSIRETTLAGNQWLDDARQMDWSSRYVYQGADDDILAEDHVEYRDQLSAHSERDERDYKDEHGQYSEEQDYFYKNHPKTRKESVSRKAKTNHEVRFRRKRNLNVTENILENIINATFTDKLVDRSIDSNYNATSKLKYETTTKKPILTTELRKTDTLSTMPQNIDKVSKYPKRIKISNKNKNRNKWYYDKYKLLAERYFDEMNTSQEGNSENYEKMHTIYNKASRISKQRKMNEHNRKSKAELWSDNTDDGITKSMYEMYYKKKPAKTPFFYPESNTSPRKNYIKRKKYDIKRFKLNRDSIDGSNSQEYKRDKEGEDTREDSEEEFKVKQGRSDISGMKYAIARGKIDHARSEIGHGRDEMIYYKHITAHARRKINRDRDNTGYGRSMTYHNSGEIGQVKAKMVHDRDDTGYGRSRTDNNSGEISQIKAKVVRTRDDTGYGRSTTGHSSGEIGQIKAKVIRNNTGRRRSTMDHNSGEISYAKAKTDHNGADFGHFRRKTDRSTEQNGPDGNARGNKNRDSHESKKDKTGNIRSGMPKKQKGGIKKANKRIEEQELSDVELIELSPKSSKFNIVDVQRQQRPDVEDFDSTEEYDPEDFPYRRKRSPEDAMPTLPEGDEDLEYIITLRPTQIRTFVIYFEQFHKN